MIQVLVATACGALVAACGTGPEPIVIETPVAAPTKPAQVSAPTRPPATASAISPTPTRQLATPAARKLNLNTADAAALEKLPRIGATLARRIVEYRDKNGAFARLDDVRKVQGVSAQVLDAIEDLVTVESN